MLNSKFIGSKITEARKKINLSQAQLAEQLFISSQAVGKWERGESMPDIITFNRLAEILGVDLNYFSENFSSSTVDRSKDQPAGFHVGDHDEGMGEKHENTGNGRTNSMRWDMSRENLIDTDFSGLKNLREKFSSSNMQRCLFIGSEMSGLLLKGNNINSCDFSNSDISRSHIQGSNLVDNSFKNCTLKETGFSGSYIMGCDFQGADLTGANFKSGGFQNNPVADAVWNHTSFNSMWIVDIVFEGNLIDCYIENCNFRNVIFRNSTLTNTFFKNNKKLNKVQFIDCKADKLTYAFLKNGKADLTGVTLLTE